MKLTNGGDGGDGGIDKIDKIDKIDLIIKWPPGGYNFYPRNKETGVYLDPEDAMTRDSLLADSLACAIKSGEPIEYFLAKDGSTHLDMDGVREANERYDRENFQFKAMDGSLHPNMAGVIEANKRYWDLMKINPNETIIYDFDKINNYPKK